MPQVIVKHAYHSSFSPLLHFFTLTQVGAQNDRDYRRGYACHSSGESTVGDLKLRSLFVLIEIRAYSPASTSMLSSAQPSARDTIKPTIIDGN
jgi:hypothetical protein